MRDFPELVKSVDLCLPNGRLNPAAVGFSRKPLHRSNLDGWGRNKRWEYWGIITPSHIIGLTISDLDYLGVHQLYCYNRQTGEAFEEGVMAPFAPNTVLPDSTPPISAAMHSRKLKLDFTEEQNGNILITARSKRVSLSLLSAPTSESLSVVVPWSEKRFQYTVKDLARVVSGSFTIDGVEYRTVTNESWSVLDRGRGKWPYQKTWNWAAGSGLINGQPFGIQFGGKWTEGTPATENAIIVDGKLHYLADEVQWDYDPQNWNAPWRITSNQADLIFTPFKVRIAKSNALVISSFTAQAFGYWAGEVIDNSGRAHRVDGLTGWAEEARNRW